MELEIEVFVKEDEEEVLKIWKSEIKRYSELYSTQYFQFFHSFYFYIFIGVILYQKRIDIFAIFFILSIFYIVIIKIYVNYSFNKLLESEIDMKNIQEFYLSTKRNNFFILKENEIIKGFIGIESISKDQIEIKRFIVEVNKEKVFESMEKLFEKVKEFGLKLKIKSIVVHCSSYEKNLVEFASLLKWKSKNSQQVKELVLYEFEIPI
jgi:hypothetical protein